MALWHARDGRDVRQKSLFLGGPGCVTREQDDRDELVLSFLPLAKVYLNTCKSRLTSFLSVTHVPNSLSNDY